jgi:hypothetical protein
MEHEDRQYPGGSRHREWPHQKSLRPPRDLTRGCAESRQQRDWEKAAEGLIRLPTGAKPAPDNRRRNLRSENLVMNPCRTTISAMEGTTYSVDLPIRCNAIKSLGAARHRHVHAIPARYLLLLELILRIHLTGARCRGKSIIPEAEREHRVNRRTSCRR